MKKGINKGTTVIAKLIDGELWGLSPDEAWAWVVDNEGLDRAMFDEDCRTFGSATAIYNAGFLNGWADRNEREEVEDNRVTVITHAAADASVSIAMEPVVKGENMKVDPYPLPADNEDEEGA
jgi:hypothetical protein